MAHHLPCCDRSSVTTNTPSDATNHDRHREDTGTHGEELEPITKETAVSKPKPSIPPPETTRPAKRKYNGPTSLSPKTGPPLDGIYERLNQNHQAYYCLSKSVAQWSLDLVTEKDPASLASQASRVVLFERDKPRKIECQERIGNTAGLGWWPSALRVGTSALCAECRAINFKAGFYHRFVDLEPWIQIYERDTAHYTQTVEDSEGIVWKVNDTNCQFCRCLIAARRRRSGQVRSEAGKYYIVFHNRPETEESRIFREEQGFGCSLFEVYITVVNHPSLHIFRPGPKGAGQDFQDALNTIICHINKPVRRGQIPQIVLPGFNSSLAISWLDACRKHPECTTEHNFRMPETRLIDCNARKLISVGHDTAPRPCFVALSYVWGPPRNDETMTEAYNLPSKLPLTLEDAMTVTKALGFQYLWIDQYCIDQSDIKDKQRQIRHMDSIYRCAYITIIAAAGTDRYYGLPGVSERLRDVLEPFVLDETFTFGGFPLVKNHWKSGSWHTRGWTFQEAHLSRRRLVFSDTAMQFECMRHADCTTELYGGFECSTRYAVTKSSPVDFPSERPYSTGGWFDIEPVVGDFTLSKPVKVYGGPSRPMTYESSETSILSYTEMVAEYTRRKLSYPSDGLNAFRGAANALAQFDPPVYSIAGIPFVFCGYGEDELAEITLSYGLAWKSSVAGVVPESDVPSWSWGHVRVWRVFWRRVGFQPSQRIVSNAIDCLRGIQIEFIEDGIKESVRLIDFAVACRDSMPLSRKNPTALYFKARILSSRVIPRNSTETRPESNFVYGGSDQSDSNSLEGGVTLYVGVNEQSYKSGIPMAHRVDDSQERCLLKIHGDKLYDNIVSGICSLMHLRCDIDEAQVLVVEWQDEPWKPRRTARRVGIIDCFVGTLDKRRSTKNFLSYFSIERDLRLI